MSSEENTDIRPYLTFKLEDELFAVEVSKVREVLDMNSVTKVPNAPDFMKGIINVRGSVVPVVDLHIKFGRPEKENTIDTRIIVMEINIDNEMVVLGAISDSVHEVMDLNSEMIENPPKIGARWNTEYIKGIGKKDDDFIIVLDIERVFSADELVMVQEKSGDMDDASQEIDPD